jgi:hypothetical protein
LRTARAPDGQSELCNKDAHAAGAAAKEHGIAFNDKWKPPGINATYEP